VNGDGFFEQFLSGLKRELTKNSVRAGRSVVYKDEVLASCAQKLGHNACGLAQAGQLARLLPHGNPGKLPQNKAAGMTFDFVSDDELGGSQAEWCNADGAMVPDLPLIRSLRALCPKGRLYRGLPSYEARLATVPRASTSRTLSRQAISVSRRVFSDGDRAEH
jgi:hypothetical protein